MKVLRLKELAHNEPSFSGILQLVFRIWGSEIDLD